ncbi:MAG: hypothetical protein KC442_23430 [Thermomicrobiales bacterium]|nr:hypothetical protein [Thermomicrobiales bacterium]
MIRPGSRSPRGTLIRDGAVGIALVLLTWLLWQQAQQQAPAFRRDEVHVLEGAVAGFTTVDSPEHAGAPQRNTSVLRPRSAFWLEDSPPNLLFYLRGSPWAMAQDIPVGTRVRLEVVADPIAQADRARQFPDATFAQPLVGLVVGDQTIRSASETITQAEAAARAFQQAATIAGVAALGWMAWAGWRWRTAVG